MDGWDDFYSQDEIDALTAAADINSGANAAPEPKTVEKMSNRKTPKGVLTQEELDTLIAAINYDDTPAKPRTAQTAAEELEMVNQELQKLDKKRFMLEIKRDALKESLTGEQTMGGNK